MGKDYGHFKTCKGICVRCNVSEAELARRLGKFPKSFYFKMKRGSFLIPEIEQMADVLGVTFNRKLINVQLIVLMRIMHFCGFKSQDPSKKT